MCGVTEVSRDRHGSGGMHLHYYVFLSSLNCNFYVHEQVTEVSADVTEVASHRHRLSLQILKLKAQVFTLWGGIIYPPG